MDDVLLSNKSQGTFNPLDWISEGDGLYASARLMRTIWHQRRRKLRTIRHLQSSIDIRTWHEVAGLPKASMVLLGYAVEMYLKGGLAKAYRGCREKMFDRDTRSRFSHNYLKLAKEVDFPANVESSAALDQLSDLVIAGARYPIVVGPLQDYSTAWNSRTRATWSSSAFRSYRRLADQVRQHVQTIDANSADMAIFKSLQIGADGYLTLRIGGTLRTRITYRLSAVQRDRGDTFEAIRPLLHPTAHHEWLRCWDEAMVVEDGKKRTVVLRE